MFALDYRGGSTMQTKRLMLALVVAIVSHGTPWADTHAANSCSFSDVAAAYNLSSAGDTVTIPAGSATWSSVLTLAKAITLGGSGKDSTIISGTGKLIDISPGSNVPVRLTGIGFDGASVHINGNKTNSYCLESVRIDHCAFKNGKDDVFSEGWVEGLIDHNFFLNCNRAILIVGDNNYAWGRAITAGSSHALFIEDNIFKQTNAGGGGLNESVYHWEGARTVIRNNDFDGSEYTSYPFVPFDSHGNQGYYSSGNVSRGQPILEVYNNTFRYHHSYRICYFRSGSILFHNNVFTFVTSDAEIVLTEEESWQSAFFSPLRTVWAAEDQVMNSFFWNNTRNGSPITNISLGNGSDAAFIQKDRDYFMHAPEPSGGKSIYTGRAGGAESFSGTGANAYYPYSPFTYPHPLQALGENAPASPTGLKIKNQ
jgi:hypothetical protein